MDEPLNFDDVYNEWVQIDRQVSDPIVINFGKFTLIFILINVLVYVLSAFFPLVQLFAMNRVYMFQLWRWVTSLFFHFSITHLLFNMISLFIFGNIIERRLGSRNFLLLYFLSGIFGNVGFLLFSSPYTFGAGASGSIFGLIGAATILYPNLVLYINFIPLPLKVAGPLMALGEFILLLGARDGIAHSAHVFGFVVGIVLAFYLRRRELEYSRSGS